MSAQQFFRNTYDPTDEDIRGMFPAYAPLSQDQWLSQYTADGSQSPENVATFALQKLSPVTTSYRLSNDQMDDLGRLARGETTRDGLVGFEGYTRTLTARQLGYVGW